MSQLVCWNCGENLDDIPRPISRHSSCPKCFNELHCCRLCRHYDPKATVTCHEDRAEAPLQKENANFCEFFTPQFGAFEDKTASKSDAARNQLGELFGSPDAEEPTEPDTSELQGQTEKQDPQRPEGKEELAKKKLDDLFG